MPEAAAATASDGTLTTRERLIQLAERNHDFRDRLAELRRRGTSIQSKQANRASILTPENMRRFQKDPVAYCREIHNMTLTPDQKKTFESVRDNRYTAVQAHNSSGKTHVSGLIANWWYDCWEEHICLITSVTWSQALGTTFKKAFVQRQMAGLGGKHLQGWIKDPDPLRAALKYTRAINVEVSESLKGEHSAPVLVIIEEATGVKEFVWTGVDTLMTHSSCRILAIGNPTDQATPFGENCASTKYNTIICSALDHPNIIAELAGKPQPFPGAISLLWLTEYLEEHCVTTEADDNGDAFEFYDLSALQEIVQHNMDIEEGQSPIGVTPDTSRVWYIPNSIFQGAVLGIFPTVPDEQVIPLGWLVNLPQRPWPLWEPKMHMPTIGVDVARAGKDRTVITAQIAGKAIAIRIVNQMDTFLVKSAIKEMAERVATFCQENLFDREGNAAFILPREIPMRIDTTGGLGSGPADALRADVESDEEAEMHGHYSKKTGQLRPRGYNVIDCNSQERAVFYAKFARKRSEIWWSTREQVKAKLLDFSNLPPDQRNMLFKELSAPKYTIDGMGRFTVEDKNVTKGKIGQSPDIADSFNLSAYHRLGAAFVSVGLRRGLPAEAVQPKPTAASTVASQDANGQFIPPSDERIRGRFGSRYAISQRAGSSTY